MLPLPLSPLKTAVVTPALSPAHPNTRTSPSSSISMSVYAKVTDWEARTMGEASSCFRIGDGPHSLLVFVF